MRSPDWVERCLRRSDVQGTALMTTELIPTVQTYDLRLFETYASSSSTTDAV
jgi:hypothetical protein